MLLHQVTLKTEAQEIIIHADHTKQAIPVIQCNTDSHQLYDAVQSIHPIQDKRL